jgi:phosphoribosylformylglycinamidine cyclo-ligase
VAAPVGFEIDRPIEPHPLFGLIQRLADADDSIMFEVFNMGIGFCYVVDPAAAGATLAILKKHGRTAQRIGYARIDRDKVVRIPSRALTGQHKRFWKESGMARRPGQVRA